MSDINLSKIKRLDGSLLLVFRELVRQLGPKLNDLEFGTSILPSAVPAWSRVAKEPYLLENAPDLVNRLLKHIEATGTGPTTNTLAYQRKRGLRGRPLEELW